MREIDLDSNAIDLKSIDVNVTCESSGALFWLERITKE